MITCRELIDFLSDYLDGSLPDADLSAFEEHLAVCPECQNYVESFRMSIGLSSIAYTSPDDLAPADVPAELLEAIMALRNSSRD